MNPSSSRATAAVAATVRLPRAVSLRDAAWAARAAATVFPRGQTEVGDELAGMSKAGEVTYLGDDGGGDNRSHAFRRLQGSHLLGPGRFRKKFAYLLLEFFLTRAPWLALEPKVVSQQELLNVDAISSNVRARGMSCANKVTECFAELVR